MHVEPHEPLEALRQRARREPQAKLAQRLRVIVLATEHWTAEAIHRAVDLSVRQVQEWVRRYNREGQAGLQDRQGRGPKAMLTAEEVERLKTRLDAGPRPEDHVCTLRGIDVQRILIEEFGKLRKLGAVYHLLHGLGYSSLAPRPQHRWANPAAQAAFQKSFPTG